MKVEAALFLVVLALVYNTVAAPLYTVGTATPDFVVIAFLYLAFFAPTLRLLLFTTVVSFALDVFSIDPIGSRAAALVPTVWLVSRLQDWFVLESALLRWMVLFPATIVSLECRRAFLFFSGEELALSFQTHLLCALYTSGLGLVVHCILDRFRPPLGWVRDRTFAGWK